MHKIDRKLETFYCDDFCRLKYTWLDVKTKVAESNLIEVARGADTIKKSKVQMQYKKCKNKVIMWFAYVSVYPRVKYLKAYIMMIFVYFLYAIYIGYIVNVIKNIH